MNSRLNTTRGLAAGFIAAAAFAVWFLLVDIVQGQPLRTPAYMSGLVFSFTTALPASARLLAFTLIHFISFGIVGIVAVKILDAFDTVPTVALGVVAGFLLFVIVFYTTVMGIGVNVVRELGWPQVLSANMVAGAVMFGYLRAKQGVG